MCRVEDGRCAMLLKSNAQADAMRQRGRNNALVQDAGVHHIYGRALSRAGVEQWATASKRMQYNGTMGAMRAQEAQAHEVMNARLGWMVTPGGRYGRANACHSC